MLYTVTFNPAIDYVMHLPSLVPGSISRSTCEAAFFGGKGINVSQVLRQLGVPSTALGFAAGFTGDALERGLAAAGIDTDFVHLPQGLTRINVKLRADEETDINGRGPAVDEASLGQLFARLEKLQAGDTLVLAGSIPAALPEDIYEQMLRRLDGRGVRFAVDTTGQALRRCLSYRPFLIKPNAEELGELFGVTIDSPQTAAVFARRLQHEGAANVLVSLGGQGAVLEDETGACRFRPALAGRPVNTVGAGDSMVAGFLAGWLTSGDYVRALRLGTAAGAAAAFSEGLGSRQQIDTLLAAAEETADRERLL